MQLMFTLIILHHLNETVHHVIQVAKRVVGARGLKIAKSSVKLIVHRNVPRVDVLDLNLANVVIYFVLVVALVQPKKTV